MAIKVGDSDRALLSDTSSAFWELILVAILIKTAGNFVGARRAIRIKNLSETTHTIRIQIVRVFTTATPQ